MAFCYILSLLPNKKAPSASAEKALCPRLDSNQHAVSSATTSRWCVYQFRHPGIWRCKFKGKCSNFILSLLNKWANLFILIKQSEKLFLFQFLNSLQSNFLYDIVLLFFWTDLNPSPIL